MLHYVQLVIDKENNCATNERRNEMIESLFTNKTKA